MKNNQKERLMTNAEKEQFLNRVKIESEDFVGTDDPKVIFEKSLQKYQDDMIEQVRNLDKLIKVQKCVREKTEQIYTEQETSGTLDLDTLKSEIATKDKVINGAMASSAVMEEKIRLGRTLIPKLVNNYELICDLDFYFSGVLNLSETPKRVQQVVENNVKE